jgi:hypothetical protein
MQTKRERLDAQHATIAITPRHRLFSLFSHAQRGSAWGEIPHQQILMAGATWEWASEKAISEVAIAPCGCRCQPE